ncbi:MAG: response regulator transcription factor [Candidatus Omnitrophica bacterium]|nr:response regulator transcription factor [Candidatus Omnitrophota bacterium]
MKKVLIIDDEADLVELLKARLEQHQYEISTAFNGEEGFQVLEKVRPDLIILDVAMPKVDGYMFVQQFKQRENLQGIPILILTAKNTLHELFEAEGFYDYLVKPFEAEILLARIEELIGR